MGFFDDARAQAARPIHRPVEIIHLKPEQDTVPDRSGIRMDEIGVFFLVPGMELQEQMV